MINSDSPNSSKSETVVPLKVVTRAQAKAKQDLSDNGSKSERSMRAKQNIRYRKNKKNKREEINEPNQEQSEDPEFKETIKEQPCLGRKNETKPRD